MNNKFKIKQNFGLSVVEVIIVMFGVVISAMAILQLVLNSQKQKKQTEEKNNLTSIAQTLIKERAMDPCISILTRIGAIMNSSYTPDGAARTINHPLTYSDALNLTSTFSGNTSPKDYIPPLNSAGLDISTLFNNHVLRLYPSQQVINGTQTLSYFVIQYTRAPYTAASVWKTIPALETYKTQAHLFDNAKCD